MIDVMESTWLKNNITVNSKVEIYVPVNYHWLCCKHATISSSLGLSWWWLKSYVSGRKSGSPPSHCQYLLPNWQCWHLLPVASWSTFC